YRIADVVPGRYFVHTSRDGVYFPGVTSISEAMAVTVAASATTANIDIKLPPALTGFRIAGRVLRPPGQPAEAIVPLSPNSFPDTGPSVQLSSPGDAQPPASAPIAPDGSFEIAHVRAGAYEATVSPAPGMMPVRVVVDRDISGLDLQVPRLAQVDGTF